jgi:hypothetical protein
LAADDTTKGFANWNAVTTYSVDDIVRAANGVLYIAIVGSNQNNEPTASATEWSQVQLLRTYNANETYVIGNVVVDSVGDVYRSLTNGNVGNTPSSSPTDWTSIVAGAFAGTVTVGGTLGVTGVATFTSIIAVNGAASTFTNDNQYIQLLRDATGAFGYLGTALNTTGGSATDFGIRAEGQLILGAGGGGADVTISTTGVVTFVSYIKTQSVAVAGLIAAGTAGASARSFVTDANATTFASIVAGGGANGVPVYSDGTNWRIG